MKKGDGNKPAQSTLDERISDRSDHILLIREREHVRNMTTI